MVDLWQVSHTVTPLCMAVLGLDVNPYALVAWQLAQPVTTGTLVWNLAGSQLVPKVVLWQVVQLAVVTMWLASLPVAAVPLWQLAQLVATVKLL